MCMGGGKKSTPAPAPVAPAPNPANVADNSNDMQQRQQAIAATGGAMPASGGFGSELGTSSPLMPGSN